MIAIQIKPKNIELSVYSNFNDKVIDLSPGDFSLISILIQLILKSFFKGIHVFGNNKIEDKFWPKVRAGRQKFEQIVNKYDKIESKSQLIDALFQLLSDKTKYLLIEMFSNNVLFLYQISIRPTNGKSRKG